MTTHRPCPCCSAELEWQPPTTLEDVREYGMKPFHGGWECPECDFTEEIEPYVPDRNEEE